MFAIWATDHIVQDLKCAALKNGFGGKDLVHTVSGSLEVRRSRGNVRIEVNADERG
jgi:hypothetical protein